MEDTQVEFDSRILKKITDEILDKSPEMYKRLEKDIENMNDEGKVYYALGFSAGIKLLSDNTFSVDHIRKAVRSIPTKATDKILEYLYNHSECYHGELAKATNVSDSRLSTIIKKIEQCSIPLLEISKEGKYKVYNLTYEGRQYVNSMKKTKKQLRIVEEKIKLENKIPKEASQSIDSIDEIQMVYDKIKTEKRGREK